MGRSDSWPASHHSLFTPGVKVYNRSGAGNGHFRDLQTTVNDVRKAEKTSPIFYRKCNSKSLLTATTLAVPSIKTGVLVRYILNNENAQKFV